MILIAVGSVSADDANAIDFVTTEANSIGACKREKVSPGSQRVLPRQSTYFLGP